MNHPHPVKPKQAVRVWHLLLAIVAIGMILRAGLGMVPAQVASDQKSDSSKDQAHRVTTAPAEPGPSEIACTQPTVEVLPFDLQGEVPGPLLTNILQQVLPGSTPDQADDLRDTLPPGVDPRMIVIIPEDNGPLF